jgi:hypothetical protein
MVMREARVAAASVASAAPRTTRTIQMPTASREIRKGSGAAKNRLPTQVTRGHLVGRGWWDTGLGGEGEPALQAGEDLGPHGPGDMGLGPGQPGRALGRVQPDAQVGGQVEAVDGAIFAAVAAGGGAEDLDAQIAGEGPGGAADAGQELLVGGLVAGLDPPGDRGGDRPVGAGGQLRFHACYPPPLSSLTRTEVGVSGAPVSSLMRIWLPATSWGRSTVHHGSSSSPILHPPDGVQSGCTPVRPGPMARASFRLASQGGGWAGEGEPAVPARSSAKRWWSARDGRQVGRLIRRHQVAGFRVRRGWPARAGGKLGCAVGRHSELGRHRPRLCRAAR